MLMIKWSKLFLIRIEIVWKLDIKFRKEIDIFSDKLLIDQQRQNQTNHKHQIHGTNKV